jgi:hypothetical protein
MTDIKKTWLAGYSTTLNDNQLERLVKTFATIADFASLEPELFAKYFSTEIIA